MNRNFFILLTFIALHSAGLPVIRADDAVSRDEAIRMAFENSPELKIAALEIKRADSRLRWSGRLENPELELSASDDGVGADENESSYEVAFSQQFPLTSKLRKEKGLRHYQVLLAEAEIAERRRELAGEVDRAMVELIGTREKIRLAREGMILNKKIVDFLQEQSKLGEVSKLDVLQANLNGRTLDQEVKLLLTQEGQKRMGLNHLVGLEATADFNIEGSLDLPGARPSGEANLSAILNRRPDHVIALAKTDEARAAVALEEAKRWDDIAVKFFVEGEAVVDEPTGLERNTFAGIGVSIPLPLRQRNQDGIAQAKIDAEAATEGVEAAQFHVRAECEVAYRRRLDSWELAREARGELQTLAEENLAEFRAAYEKGEATLIQVQTAQEQVLEIQSAAVAFLTDYHLAEAQVRFVTGAYPCLIDSSDSDK